MQASCEIRECFFTVGTVCIVLVISSYGLLQQAGQQHEGNNKSHMQTASKYKGYLRCLREYPF